MKQKRYDLAVNVWEAALKEHDDSADLRLSTYSRKNSDLGTICEAIKKRGYTVISVIDGHASVDDNG